MRERGARQTSITFTQQGEMTTRNKESGKAHLCVRETPSSSRRRESTRDWTRGRQGRPRAPFRGTRGNVKEATEKLGRGCNISQLPNLGQPRLQAEAGHGGLAVMGKIEDLRYQAGGSWDCMGFLTMKWRPH